MKQIKILILLVATNSWAQVSILWVPLTYKVRFSIDHALGATAEGKFSGLSAEIFFNANALDKSSIYASVPAQTFDTDNTTRDQHIKAEKYLNVLKYPTITMKSTKIIQSGKGWVGYFDITMKGITKSTAIPFSFSLQGERAVFEARFQINRLDYGIGPSSFMLGDVVTVMLWVETFKKQ